ncbi:MAG: hypothetical protein M3063_09375 [Actinomycetota bacterium]|nr:hypothetical protein [Actinomycetota bacterium]
MGSTDGLADLARPLLSQAGLQLWDIELGPSVVRILVDRGDGIDLDALSAAAAALSPLLDERDDLVPAGRYELEVSSPGIERTLRTVDQYRRYLGSLLAIKTTVAVDGARRLRATLVAVTDDTIEIMVVGSAEPVTVSLDQIDRARTVLEWGPQAKQDRPKPGKAKPGKAKRGEAKRGEQGRSSRSMRLAEAASPGANDDKDRAS